MNLAGRGYHHGDLAAALVSAGLELARSGGVSALGLREVTRAVGVTPNAAYRHFADRQALVHAIAAQAEQQLAKAMELRMSESDGEADPARRAFLRLRAVGLAYIDFAVTEPGLFEVAFYRYEHVADNASPTDNELAEAPPYLLLLSALDDLVSAGALSTEHRSLAEWACWSAVHGFSDLLTRGPLQGQDPATIEQLAEYVVDRAIASITYPGAPFPVPTRVIASQDAFEAPQPLPRTEQSTA